MQAMLEKRRMYNNAQPYKNNTGGAEKSIVTTSGKHSCSHFERSVVALSFRVAVPRSAPPNSATDLPSPCPHQTSQSLVSSVCFPRKTRVIGPSSKLGPR